MVISIGKVVRRRPPTAASRNSATRRLHVAVRRRIRGREPRLHASEILGRLRGRRARCQPAKALKRTGIALLARVCGHLRERLPQPGPRRKREALAASRQSPLTARR